jgi:hypothetical protein
MPSRSEAQARTMAAAAHDPSFAKKVGIPQKVARDYNEADKGGKLLRSAMADRLRGEKGKRPR